MRYLSLILSSYLLFVSLSASAQDIYYDSNWKKTNKSNAQYYRIIDTISAKNFLVEDYYIHGQIQMNGYYSSIDKEIKHGKFSYYSSKGIKTKDCSYSNGKLDGQFLGWYKNGNTEVQGVYNNGKKDSLWFFYDSLEILTSSGTFDNGVATGTWVKYYPDGTKKEQIEMNNDKFSGQAVVWNSNGEKKGEINLDPKFANGTIKIYYPNGNLQTEGQFKNKKADGIWSIYYPSGTKKAEGLISKGYLLKKWNYYDENGGLDKIIIYDKKNTEKFPVDLNQVKKMMFGN